jgi:hypothetical protein
MIKRRKNNTKKKSNGKVFKENDAEARKINASTVEMSGVHEDQCITDNYQG